MYVPGSKKSDQKITEKFIHFIIYFAITNL